MTKFNLFLSRGVVESMKSLDDELREYFQTSTSFRSRARNGTIVIIDQSTGLFDFLNSLVQKCQLKFRVVQVDDAKNARKLLEELGQRNVKAVVIHSKLLFKPTNGETLAQWVNENYPDIPVWISECPPDKNNTVRQTSQRVGIIDAGCARVKYLEMLGFPSRCREAALNSAV